MLAPVAANHLASRPTEWGKHGSREVLPRATGGGRIAPLQSDASSLGEPASGGPLPLLGPPNRLPPPLSSDGGADGLNLDPLDHLSSLSARPAVPSAKPEVLRLNGGASSPPCEPISEGGGACRRGGPEDRQSLMFSETDGSCSLSGGPPPPPPAPSKRRRGGSREGSLWSCVGLFDRQGLSNLASSSKPPPNPERSLAEKASEIRGKIEGGERQRTYEVQPR